MFSINRFICAKAKFLVSIFSVFFAASAFADPQPDILDETHAAVRAVMAAQDEITPSLMQRPEILGTAVGLGDTGNPVLMVYVHREAANVEQTIRNLPGEVRGTPVRVELVDEIRAMGNTAKQTPPISLGTSSGWAYDLANGYCCGGTLGALVRIGNTQYILSACHVLEGDTVLGGDNRIAHTGDPLLSRG
jgi:hypothetical protein